MTTTTWINVNGLMRPKHDANGVPIHTSDDAIKNFWHWFGDSKIVDPQGRPLVIHHGTAEQFDSFKEGRGGFYFTDDRKAADAYAEHAESESDDSAPRVVSAFLSIKNPLILDFAWYEENVIFDGEPNWEAVDNTIYEAADNGHDGIVLLQFPDFDGMQDGIRMERQYNQYIAFAPSQIKSATDNCGLFTPHSTSITDRFPSSRKEFTHPMRQRQA